MTMRKRSLSCCATRCQSTWVCGNPCSSTSTGLSFVQSSERRNVTGRLFSAMVCFSKLSNQPMSVHLRAGSLDHLGPFFVFGFDQVGELGRGDAAGDGPLCLQLFLDGGGD